MKNKIITLKFNDHVIDNHTFQDLNKINDYVIDHQFDIKEEFYDLPVFNEFAANFMLQEFSSLKPTGDIIENK